MRATFPHQLLWQDVTPRFVGASREPQQSISGADTIVPAMGGRWEATCSFVIKGEGAQLAWQAFQAQMEGRIGTTLVPIRTRFRPRDANGRAVTACTVAGLAGAQTFEHFGFANAPIIGARLASAAPLRATQIAVELVDSIGIRPGQFFSIGERVNQVQHHWQAGGVHYLTLRSPLRRAAAAGSRMELFAPVCLMRMVSEEEGEFDHLLDRMPRIICRFVEVDAEVPPLVPVVSDPVTITVSDGVPHDFVSNYEQAKQ